MRRTRPWAGVVFGAAAFAGLSLVVAPAAFAQDRAGLDENDRIVITGGLVVGADETVQTAVVVNGPVTIDGTVDQTLVVFNGRTEISGTVNEDVIVFNGAVVLHAGARVGGDLITRQTPRIDEGATVEGSVDDLPTRWDLWDVTFVGRLAWWLAFTVSSLVLGLLLLLLVPGLDPASIRAMRDRLGATIGFGILWLVVLPIVAVVLMVTIVGIPLGLFLLLALALVYSIGYVIGALALGRLVVKEPTSRYLAFLAGWGALRLLAVIPVLGGLVWLMGTVLGLGTLWVARSRPRTMEPVAAPAVPPPPAPA